MYSIGEFSKITGLSVKTLRFYHEQGVLKPTCVDDQTGYRYYDDTKIETARVIRALRDLEVPLDDVAEILRSHEDEGDVLEFLERHRQAMEAKLRQLTMIRASLDRIILQQREARRAMQNATFEVQEKVVDSLLIAGVRMQGRYSECGKGFSQIGRRMGRYISGKPLLLIYDAEYKEDDADFEACMPVSKETTTEGISVRPLAGGRCVSLVHLGPYEELGRSYAKILDYVKRKGYKLRSPCREVYLKGPGMIFKGNPKKYLTEIQMLIEE
ncbi:MAG: MerR family transcriptional regulator [Planctomycetia bacterium]|nr:MerR family transcriptional regulator [Planctomycetia bacterium]